ncbi:MAG: DUF4190 domain-containing protein [Phycisphaerae bacterium]
MNENYKTTDQSTVVIDKPVKCKTSVASLLLALSVFIIGLFGSIAGLIIGIIAIRKIKKSNGLLSGYGYAITGIILSAIPLLLTGLVIVSFSYKAYYGGSLSDRDPRSILKNGRLASLPTSATNIKAEGWSAIFTGEDFLMFKASPDDIEKFLSQSESIKRGTPKLFDHKQMHIPYPNTENAENQSNENDIYFFRSNHWPIWYDPTIKIKGRKYEIPSDVRGHNWGSVIIDDETSTVYISVIWS